MNAIIRRGKIEDASHIIIAHVTSIRELCAKDYTPEQIKAWAGRNFTTENWIHRIISEWVWVAEVDSFVEGVAHFRKVDDDHCYIDALYITHRAVGKGVGKALATAMIEEARKLKFKKIELQSTLTSLKFYEKMGFKIKEGGKKTAVIGGAELPAIEMEYFL